MPEMSLFDILELPEESLKRVLRQAPARALARLFSAYPRTVSRTFTTLLSQCLSQPTMAFLSEEINAARLPSFSQIREAENELIKIVAAEKLFPTANNP